MAADEDFQRRASEEGRKVQEIAGRVLKGCGFKDLRPNERFSDIGVTVNYIATDDQDQDWHFDVSGAFTSRRAGLIRTDTTWKTLGRANVLHQAGVQRVVLLTTNLPTVGSVGDRALRAASDTFFDAVEMMSQEGKARLALYAQGRVQRPLPGLRTPASVYSGLREMTVEGAHQVRVPVPELAPTLPDRVRLDAKVMPNRLKIFLPSKTASGRAIRRADRELAGVRIRSLLSACAGGCTMSPGVGSWIDPIGGEMFEDVILVEAYSQEPFPDELVSRALDILFNDLGQHTAALIVNDAMVHVTPA